MHRYPKFMQMIDTAWRLQEHAGCRQRHSWGRFQRDGCCCGAAAVLLLGAVVYPKTCGRGESERAEHASGGPDPEATRGFRSP